MNSVDTFKTRLREEIAAVEQEIDAQSPGRGAEQTTGGYETGE
jgi:hypothetical protein